tara:strand:- start:17656 stop:17814 length:159 start_codon:yes stop_codon:yes gene_type:complete
VSVKRKIKVRKLVKNGLEPRKKFKARKSNKNKWLENGTSDDWVQQSNGGDGG